jgi:Group II intron, maturase-specific domain
VRQILNHWTQHRSITEVVEELNTRLRGWCGYFHFRHSTQVIWDLQGWVRARFKGWLWRKHGCKKGKWKGYPDDLLHGRYGLWRMPTRAAWKTT